MTRRPSLGPTATVVLMAMLAACGADAPSTPPITPASKATSPTASVAPSATPGIAEVEPAPGSGSIVYAPNPSEIVVAVEAGHGGCLDWGVPDPEERGPEYAEKAITMAVARELAALLEADGVRAVLVRDGDEALAGDHYPPLGCEGAAFRDVNGDGLAGFGPDLPEATRTRDELQARLDRANLAGADVLVSIHVDSITGPDGTPLAIARTETFYTDETPWGVPLTESLAGEVQASVVAAVDAVAGYERQDRGTNAHNLYIVAPPLDEPTPDRPDPLRQPTRGALMPAILVEVGSITRSEEHELLLSEDGAAAAAQGIFDGLAAWFADRPLAGRLRLVETEAGTVPQPVDGDGPPFAPPVVDGERLWLRVTNTGSEAWPAGARLLVDRAEPSDDEPYLYGVPEGAGPIGPGLPALGPGASVIVELDLRDAGGGRLAWISLMVGTETLALHGSPALQVVTEAP